MQSIIHSNEKKHKP